MLRNQENHWEINVLMMPWGIIKIIMEPVKMKISDGPCPEKGLPDRTAPGAVAFTTGRRGLPGLGTRIFEATPLWRPRAGRRSHRQTVK